MVGNAADNSLSQPPQSGHEEKRTGSLKAIQYWVEWALLVAFRRVLTLLPWPIAIATGAAVGEIAYRLGIRRKVVFTNLALAFPDWTHDQRRRVARQSYRNAGRTLAEYILLPSLRPGQLEQIVEQVEGLGYADLVEAGRKPVIVLTGHIGNWELMGAHFARMGYSLKVFAKPLHNPRIESALLHTRRSLGLDVLYTGEGLKPAVRHLREGGILVFLADQDARKAGVAISFFGKPASTALGPAVFAQLTRAPIVPVFAIRVGTSRHRFVIFPPIQPLTGLDRNAALEQLTRSHVEALESIIRQHPEQYFWFHRRWTTRTDKTAGPSAPR